MRIVSKFKNLLFGILIIFLPHLAEAGPFIAYSLNEAEKAIKKGLNSDELMEVGGITHPVGIVYDYEKRDLIIVGQIIEGEGKISLDDFAVALQAISKHKEPPLVSIDRTDETEKTQRQRVRFEGGIKDTKFGKDLLEADIVLKKMGLGELRTDIWGVRSYFDMSAEHWENTGIEEVVSSRFWFIPSKERSFVSVREGVAVVNRLAVDVKTEVMGATKSGQSVSICDEIGDRFASIVTANFDDISNYYPPLKRLDPLFRLTGLAQGIQRESFKYRVNIDFWLEYKVKREETPDDYPLLEKEKVLERNGKKRQMTISGGIELVVLIKDLKDGLPSAFRKIVLKSRPNGNPLIWRVPLEGWQSPEAPFSKVSDTIKDKKQPNQTKLGMNLTRQFSTLDSLSRIPMNYKSTPLSGKEGHFDFTDRLLPQMYSSNIGGVMLQEVAKISGSGDVKVDLTSGNFSLIVDGQNSRIEPEAYRKFITALWAVYFSKDGPGISIDPIAPGAEKHLVRYIGKVINTDLGRVMREADYLMKKWAVGTERANVPNFKNPDDIAAEKGVVHVGAMSRFWFVPEDMKFKRAGDMLLFEDGKMSVKTEFMFKNEGMHADPSNEEFARLFTDNYEKIAEKYPVYKELFDYAKLVSLAKYLKEQGIPLFWFLMANKDLVITEDSPGTVDALAKGSDYFEEIRIEGGVDLGFDIQHEGSYVYDQEAVRAINDAISRSSSSAYSKLTLSPEGKVIPTIAEPFSFDLGKDSYTVVPQHSLTSGKDRRGIRYQTDLALRGTGFQLTEQSLDNLRYDLIRREILKELSLLLESLDKRKLEEAEVETHYKKISQKVEKMVKEILENLKRLKNQKYTTEKEFTKALEETIGKEQTAQLKLLIMEYAYYNTNLDLVRYYNPRQQGSGEFGKGWHLLIHYRIKPAGPAKREFFNIEIPEKMAVENLLTGEEEILTFSTDRYEIAGYVPERLETTQTVGLFIMSDASYRLVDKLGNEFWFDQSGYLTDMIFSEDHHIHIEYLNGFTDMFEEAPFEIKPADEEKTDIFNIPIPKRMMVKDLIHGDTEVLTLSDKEIIVGYVPEDVENSRYKILALLSDASFRLVDKKGNESSFSPSMTFDGKFEKMAIFSEHRMISSLSQGNQKIRFKYTVDKSGEVMIASANLSEGDEGAKPTYIVKYEYDDEGRLCQVIRP